MGLTGVSFSAAIGSIDPKDQVVGLPTFTITATLENHLLFIIKMLTLVQIRHYSAVSTGSNSNYSNVATGSNTSYTDAA